MGDVFAGRYELVDPLGEGGAGVVWRVWDHRHQHYCAAKVLRQVDASSLLRFMREQSLRLDHPHILAPTGWAGEDDKVLFTMPIAAGGSAATLVSDFGPLGARLTVVLLDQLLAALETIHAEGIVHRDVKPANLLLDATGKEHPHLWLGDFGIAAGEDAPRLTQGPFALGTPGYTAPESLTQGWQPEARADLYAAGMCGLEMLTGLRPEHDADVRQTLASTAPEDPVPPELAAVITGLGQRVLHQRYSSATEARAALRATGLLEPASAEQILGDVEVFQHTPPLPSGWGHQGPLTAAEDNASTRNAPTYSAPAHSRVAEQQATADPPGGTTSHLPASPATTQQQVPLLSVPDSEPQRQQSVSQRDHHPRPGQGRMVAIALLLIGSGMILLALTIYLVFS